MAREGMARAAAPLLALLALAACTEVRDATLADSAGIDTTSAPPPPAAVQAGPRDVVAIQIATLADSGAAERMRDSLERAGWTAFVRVVRQQDTLPPFRVRVLPTARTEYARLVATGFVAGGTPVALVPDVAVPATPGVTLQPVNRGARDDAVRLRWAASPDRSALLVVEDVRRDGGEPAPDGFVYVADEGGVVVQRDSVWDVTLSPNWRRLAYGRAYVISAEGRDSVSIRGWADAAARTTIQIHLLRAGAFRMSRTREVWGVAQPVVESTHPDSLRDQSLVRMVSTQVPIVGGWRVRWTRDGRILAVGTAPRGVTEGAPVARWLGVDPRSGLFERDLSSGSLHTLSWTEGPTVTAKTGPDARPRRIDIAGGSVESRDGWIVVRGTLTGGRPVVVGPGTALTATRSGQFVVALVPVPGAREGRPSLQALVYRIR